MSNGMFSSARWFSSWGEKKNLDKSSWVVAAATFGARNVTSRFGYMQVVHKGTSARPA
jgi:hypothetical protein